MDPYTSPVASSPSSSPTFIRHYPVSARSNRRHSLSEDEENGCFSDGEALVSKVNESSRVVLGEIRSHQPTKSIQQQALTAPKSKGILSSSKSEKDIKSSSSLQNPFKEKENVKKEGMLQRLTSHGFFSIFRQDKSKKTANEPNIEMSLLQTKQKRVLEEEKHDNKMPALSLLDAMASCSFGVFESRACKTLQTIAFHKLSLQDLISPHSENLANILVYMKNPEGSVLEYKALNLKTKENILFSEKSDLIDLQPILEMEKLDFHASLIGGSFENNYPLPSFGKKIFCDCFYSAILADCSFSIVADGCGWGFGSRLAAQLAIDASSKFIHELLSQHASLVRTAENLAWVLVQSLAMAHEEIVSRTNNDLVEIGTATLNICFLFRTPEGNKYLMVAGVGDCKSFVAVEIAKNQYRVLEIVCCKRLSISATDPGGRLGPYVGQDFADPDLRNLAVTCVALPKERSIILNMSDGVHDNLNPLQLGMTPSEVDPAIPLAIKWSDLPANTQFDLINRFQCKMLEGLINEAMSKENSTLDDMCSHITGHCRRVTEFVRNFMEQNLSAPEPQDKVANPGKMDHCSVVAIQTESEEFDS